MRILFITQKVDRDDDLLGVYHEWIAELSKRVERVVVICLMRGAVVLPKNVEVYSLGKEQEHNANSAKGYANGAKKLRRITRFYRYVFALRRDYDVVFVHMNTVYVLLGWWVWKLFRKPVVLWFAHYRPHWQGRGANALRGKIVTSVPQGRAVRSGKITVVGQGIDTERFSRGNVPPDTTGGSTSQFRILFLGRISPVKDLETLINAVNLLRSRGMEFHLNVVGAPTDMVRRGSPSKDAAYFEGIKRKVEELRLGKWISFLGRVPNHTTPEIYAGHDCFVNLTATGSFDKSILEAMACEVPVFVSNRAYERIFPEDLRQRLMFREKSAADCAEKIEALMKAAPEERADIGRRLREIVVRDHNIKNLAAHLTSIFHSLVASG